jgi:hypothetical protein
MNPTQYELLNSTIRPEPQVVNAKCMYNQAERTLVYGCTADKDTLHVYLEAGVVHKVVYNFKGELLLHKTDRDGLMYAECAVAKRIYPEACDFDFCAVLKRRGIALSFYVWADNREPAAFYGKRLAELKARAADEALVIPNDAEGWNLNTGMPAADTAASVLHAKLKEHLVAARAAGSGRVEDAQRIRDAMYVEMDGYRNLGARDAAAEWMLVAVIECGLGLRTETLMR